jgi:hypothetical protein
MGVSEMTMTINEPAAGEARSSIETLRQILAEEQKREVAYGEAREVGEALLDFFEALAGAS